MSDIICVTSRELCRGDFLLRVETIASSGVKAVILREKNISEKEYENIAPPVMDICKKHGVMCILHSFIDTAVRLRAKNIHLPLPRLREMTTEQKAAFEMIGASCHTEKEVKEAEDLGCSYITLGHIFETDCKKGVPSKGTEFLKNICRKTSLPVYAIGGITERNIHKVRNAGAAGACIMSGLMQCSDVTSYLNSMETSFFTKESLLLYAVTDRHGSSGEEFRMKIKQAVTGGVSIIQLREKETASNILLREAVEIKELCHSLGVPLIINDHADIAIKCGADGVHVGAEDESAKEIRKRTGKNFIIGVTAKTTEQAKKAEADGADYIGVGAVFPSPTKKNALRITKEQLESICAAVSIPAVAIGGITKDNIHELAGCGIAGAAVSSAVFAAEDTKNAAEELKKKVTDIVKGENS